MSVSDVEAGQNGTHIAGGASETRSWRSGASSPIVKLIPARPQTNDCCLSLEVSTLARPELKAGIPRLRAVGTEQISGSGRLTLGTAR